MVRLRYFEDRRITMIKLFNVAYKLTCLLGQFCQTENAHKEAVRLL